MHDAGNSGISSSSRPASEAGRSQPAAVGIPVLLSHQRFTAHACDLQYALREPGQPTCTAQGICGTAACDPAHQGRAGGRPAAAAASAPGAGPARSAGGMTHPRAPRPPAACCPRGACTSRTAGAEGRAAPPCAWCAPLAAAPSHRPCACPGRHQPADSCCAGEWLMPTSMHDQSKCCLAAWRACADSWQACICRQGRAAASARCCRRTCRMPRAVSAHCPG